MKKSQHKLLEDFIQLSLLQEKGMIDKAFGAIDKALAGVQRKAEKAAADLDRNFSKAYKNVDTGKVKQLPADFNPKESLRDQLYAVSTTMQLVGYSVEAAVDALEYLSDRMSILESSESPLEEYDDFLEAFAERMGQAIGWLKNDSLSQTSSAVSKIAEDIDVSGSPAEVALSMSKMYINIGKLKLDDHAARVISNENAKKILDEELKWASKYIQEGIKNMAEITSVSTGLSKLAEKLQLIEELMQASSESPDGEKGNDEAVAGTAFESYIRAQVKQQMR